MRWKENGKIIVNNAYDRNLCKGRKRTNQALKTVVWEAINQPSNSKLPASDETPIDLFKAAGAEAVKITSSNKSGTRLYELDSWKEWSYKTMPKKRNTGECANFRVAVLISQTSKVLSSCSE